MALFSRTFRNGLLLGSAIAIAVAAAAITYERYDTQTLKRTLRRGAVLCGVNTGLPGFSNHDASGNWSGFDVDLCRAVAAAIFNDPSKVQFVPLDASERFRELQKRKIDILARNSTWSMSRETDYQLNFAAVSYYDGQGFMLRKARNIDSALELEGSRVCVQAGTTTQLNLADYFRANKMKYESVVFATSDETVKAYDSGRCDAFTTDASGLYAERLKLTNPADHIVLPEIISKQPLGPAVRHGDDQWFDIVKWVHYAMVGAEEFGVTKANVDQMLKSDNPEIKRLLGAEGKFGETIGLTNDWAYRIIKHIGNYGESFDRNVGAGSPLKIARGLNGQWTKGGLQYAIPIR